MASFDQNVPSLSIFKAVPLDCLHQGRKNLSLLLSKLTCVVSVKMMHSTDKFRMVLVLVFSKWYDLVFDCMTFVIGGN